MKASFFSFILITVLVGCGGKTEVPYGKWYTYSESGDYMELWLSEDKSMTYLSSIDEFLLYDLKRDRNTLDFSLIESRITDKHNFQLNVSQSSEELFQAVFIGEGKVDSLKTYFIVSSEIPEIKNSLSENRENMDKLLSRMEGSHAGHGH